MFFLIIYKNFVLFFVRLLVTPRTVTTTQQKKKENEGLIRIVLTMVTYSRNTYLLYIICIFCAQYEAHVSSLHCTIVTENAILRGSVRAYQCHTMSTERIFFVLFFFFFKVYVCSVSCAHNCMAATKDHNAHHQSK